MTRPKFDINFRQRQINQVIKGGWIKGYFIFPVKSASMPTLTKGIGKCQ